MGKIFISRNKRNAGRSQIDGSDLSDKRLAPPQLSVLPSLLEKRGGHGAHTSNMEDLDGFDAPQPVLLGEGEDGGELLIRHLSPQELDPLQPLDGSSQDLSRHEGEVLEEKIKLSEPQVGRVEDPGEQGGHLAR